MARTATKAFLEQYGTRGACLLVEQVVQDWLDLEVNQDTTRPAYGAARQIMDSVLPMLEEMLDEQANGGAE